MRSGQLSRQRGGDEVVRPGVVAVHDPPLVGLYGSASTAAVYGPGEGRLEEEHPTGPTHPYGGIEIVRRALHLWDAGVPRRRQRVTGVTGPGFDLYRRGRAQPDKGADPSPVTGVRGNPVGSQPSAGVGHPR